MAKRLVFSTESPNDQGGIVPNKSIVWERYSKNPVLLSDHMWWTGAVLGIMTDIKLVNGEWSGVPIFHEATPLSREAKAMYEAGALNAASIGGEAIWKTNEITGDYVRDVKGFRECEKFFLYEISLLPLPSNADAVGKESAFSANKIKFYENNDIGITEEAMVRLSSHYNLQNMYIPKSPITRNADAGESANGGGGGSASAKPAAQSAPNGSAQPTNLGATTDTNDLPPVIRKALSEGYSVTFNANKALNGSEPAPQNTPDSKLPGKELTDPQPDPIGLKAQLAMKKYAAYQKANELASAAVSAFGKAKKEMDEADDSDVAAYGAIKVKYDAAKLSADKACQEAEKKEEEYKAAQEEADDEEMSAKAKAPQGGAAKQTFAAGLPVVAPNTKPVLKSVEELKNEVKLASAPSFKALVKAESQGVTFTQLNSKKAEPNVAKIIRDVLHADKSAGQVDMRSHAIVANSILNDPRLRAIAQKVRLMANCTEGEMHSMMNNPGGQRGQTFMELAADLNAGRVQYRNRAGQMENLTMLTSTDNALASPALNTIEWLSLAIFELFPTASWKAQIPMFGAQITSRNTGIILANIVAEPNIYKGTSPAPATDYTYTDQAVALSLTPYWLQPMLWNPLTMHQLRYDQMSTGWAQAFAKWNAVIDDNLLYTLASTTPAAAIIPTSGLSGYQAVPQSFNIPNSGAQNKFYWNPNFAGQLNYPTLNDIIGIEQVYRNQNFELERERGVLVVDPIMERYFAQDPETKSLLTSWVDRNGEEFKGFKHTQIDVRSRVAVYDPATGQVKDINSAIPATAVSAGVGFIPSQVGIGIGLLDVFMVQDPANYGYRMSADIRIGIVPIRYNFYGTSLFVFSAGNPA